MRPLYRILAAVSAAKAATRGPGALVRQRLRARANAHFNRGLRRVLRP